MYNSICTQRDVIKESYIKGATLVGKYGFPQLEPIIADAKGLKPVLIHEAGKEKNPRQSIVHCFTDDYRFEGLWREPFKSVETLLNFKYVCPCDFSVYSNMPLALQIYNVYRARAIHYLLYRCGVNCIPVATWSDEQSFDFCFDGFPEHSTLAISTNGCHALKAREYYKRGFSEMCNRLHPNRIVIIGGEIDVDCDVDIQYIDGYSQELNRKLKG